MDPLSSPSRKPTIAEMLNPSQPVEAPVSGAEPRRRQSLAEMLRSSALVGNEVPLAEALGASQAAERPRPPAAAGVERQISRYSFYLKVEGRWVWQGDVGAASHADALREAAGLLGPQHDGLPLRLEQDEATNGRAG